MEKDNYSQVPVLGDRDRETGVGETCDLSFRHLPEGCPGCLGSRSHSEPKRRNGKAAQKVSALPGRGSPPKSLLVPLPPACFSLWPLTACPALQAISVLGLASVLHLDPATLAASVWQEPLAQAQQVRGQEWALHWLGTQNGMGI